MIKKIIVKKDIERLGLKEGQVIYFEKKAPTPQEKKAKKDKIKTQLQTAQDKLDAKIDVIAKKKSNSSRKIGRAEIEGVIRKIKRGGLHPNLHAFQLIFGTRKLPFDFTDLDFNSYDIEDLKKKGFSEKDVQAYNTLANDLGSIDDMIIKINNIKGKLR